MKMSRFSLVAAAVLALAVTFIPQVAAAATQFVAFVGPDNLAMLSLAGVTLAADTPRAYELGIIEEYPVVATDIIYEGAAVGENASGYARPLVALDPFLGFAESKADNSAGAAGAVNVRVRQKGKVQLAVAGATAVTANDRPLVYALDDNSFTLTSTGATAIGRVSRWISSGVAIVEFDALVAASL